MKTLKIRAYTLDELCSQSQETAIKEYREEQEEIGLDAEAECNFLKEVFEARLINTGFTDAEVQFSLSYCQGDGLSFTCSGLDFSKLFGAYPELKAKFRKVKELDDDGAVRIFIKRLDICRYSHKQTVEVDYDEIEELTDDEGELMHSFTCYLENIKNDICDKFEKEGYEALENITTDEYIKDMLQANEYLFTKSGKRTVYLDLLDEDDTKEEQPTTCDVHNQPCKGCPSCEMLKKVSTLLEPCKKKKCCGCPKGKEMIYCGCECHDDGKCLKGD